MGEVGERERNTTGRRHGGLLAKAGLAGLVVSIATIMAFAPLGLGAHAGVVTVKAPYKGGATAFNDIFLDGCGTAKLTHKYSFALKTGFGGGSGAANAKACGKGSGGVGATSDNAVEGGFEVAVPVNFPAAGARGNVSVSVSTTWNGAVKETAPLTPACTAYAQKFNDTFGEYYNGASWSYYPNIGSPVNYTNSTFYYFYSEYGASSFCISGAEVISEMFSWITDTNTGVQSTEQFSAPVDFFTETYNQTYWYCYFYTEWDYGTWYNSSASSSYTCYSLNQTTITESYDAGTLGTNTSLTSSGTSSTTMWFNGTYNTAHHFEVYVDVQDIILAEVVGWTHGTASATMNHATLGNGVRLTSITLA